MIELAVPGTNLIYRLGSTALSTKQSVQSCTRQSARWYDSFSETEYLLGDNNQGPYCLTQVSKYHDPFCSQVVRVLQTEEVVWNECGLFEECQIYQRKDRDRCFEIDNRP